MIKTLKPTLRVVRGPAAAIAAALLVGLCGPAWAQGATPDSQGPTGGQSLFTARGPAIVTGHIGSTETTTVPGSGGQGLLMNNGNGTSTLVVPGGMPQTVETPR